MKEHISLIGQNFGRLTVVELIEGKPNYRYLCHCKCGGYITTKGVYLRSGATTSCGCYRSEVSKSKVHDLTGKKISMLTVLKRDPNTEQRKGKVKWICQCECGNIKSVRAANLLSKSVQSCGCRVARRGEKSPYWKGGVYTNSYGYVVKRFWENGIIVTIHEHRWVMEQHLGRKLFKNENIHHINGIKNDNRIDNLEIWVKTQPCGQRAKDLLVFAFEIIKTYNNEKAVGQKNVINIEEAHK